MALVPRWVQAKIGAQRATWVFEPSQTYSVPPSAVHRSNERSVPQVNLRFSEPRAKLDGNVPVDLLVADAFLPKLDKVYNSTGRASLSKSRRKDLVKIDGDSMNCCLTNLRWEPK